ncbi:MAG: hypothetical protein M1839_007537 [Geoglossum umbratile]|nr:MAG: hypothetical protein M1839_007537 [Geoglossum umbratile]
MERGRQIEEVAQAVVASSLESASHEQVGGSTVYGNSSGIGMFKELAVLRKMMTDQGRSLSLQDTRIQELENTQGNKFQELVAINEYHQIRQRFLAHFHPGDGYWRAMRQKGNEIAHAGDAVTDAKICEGLGQGDLIVEEYS